MFAVSAACVAVKFGAGFRLVCVKERLRTEVYGFRQSFFSFCSCFVSG